MPSPSVISLSLPKETIDKMLDFYADDLVHNENPNAFFVARSIEVTVTAYNKPHEGKYRVVFQGNGASHEASIWGKQEDYVPPKGKKVTKTLKAEGEQIGSDEVGTGDFFGPVIVVAAFVKIEDIPYLKELGVTDSKLLSDEKILEIAPKLLERIEYSHLRLPPEKYNKVIQKKNMNAIKALMHNRCLGNLHKKYPGVPLYQDQFAEPTLYYHYLASEKEITRGIVFATKGETKFPCVAAASVIARYSFLRSMKKLSEEYEMDFPFGAGNQVDHFAKKFIEKYGVDEMKKVAKTNFSNMKKALR